jgi:hypothetical protein
MLLWSEVAMQHRPHDDYARLVRLGDAIRLAPPDRRQVRLAGPEPHAIWELLNEHGERIERLTPLRPLLDPPSYSEDAAALTISSMRQAELQHLRVVWRYGGALVEHLYLDHHNLTFSERAARIARVLIAFFQAGAPDAEKAFPALWHAYRDALEALVAAREYLLRELEGIVDDGERNRKFEALLSVRQSVWLSGWQETLDAEYALAQRECALGMVFHTVELRIPAAATAPYRVELRSGGSGALHTSPLAIDLAALIAESDPHDYGRMLGERLFGEGEVGTAYERAWERARERGKYVRVLLRIEPHELLTLHWERLYHRRMGSWHPLGTSQGTPLVRLVDPASAPHCQDAGQLPARTLRALVIIASPRNLDGLPPITADERGHYRRLFADLADKNAIHTQFLESEMAEPDCMPTLTNLRRELLDNYDLVQIVCHGLVSRPLDGASAPEDYALLLEDEVGNCTRVTAAQLLDTLSDASQPPRLCVLAACQSAEHASSAAFVPLGEAIVQRGLAGRVVAMNGTIGITNARHFIQSFYRRLVAHRFIDLAVNEARSTIREAWDYGVPVLFAPPEDATCPRPGGRS